MAEPTSGYLASQPVTVKIDRTHPFMKTSLDVGTTFMHYTLDGDRGSGARGAQLIQSAAAAANQHIMGFGADNPEPRPGTYNWATLDHRVNLMRSLQVTPIITLCCAPTWMVDPNWKGGTDYSQLESAPLPQHEADFADLAKQVALRYPDVHYFQVWNEFKGMWDQSSNNWDYVRYTRLYNKVYEAVKSASPDAKVGGPYLPLDDPPSGELAGCPASCPLSSRDLTVLKYWLAHKDGADFIALDWSVEHGAQKHSQAQDLAQTKQFANFDEQVHSMTQLPIWWSEHYFASSDDWGFQAAGTAAMLYQEVVSGAAVGLQWEPEAQPDAPYRGNDQNLFTSTMSPDGGKPLPNYYVYEAVHRSFSPNTELYPTSASESGLLVLASARNTWLINMRPDPLTVMIEGKRVSLSRYQVVLLTTNQ